jgi:thiol-disulfide isomerase/thioredoxin
MRIFCLIFICLVSSTIESQAQKSAKVSAEKWICKVKIQDKTIDFYLVRKHGKGVSDQFILWNGKEKIDLNKKTEIGDSLNFPLSVFESKLVFPRKLTNSFSGFYINSKNQRLPFDAEKVFQSIDFQKAKSAIKIKRNWRIYFHEGGMPTDSGLLVTQQNGDSIYGTILSETGDYRFLNGKISNNAFYLQTLDGGHSYRFDYDIKGDSILGSFIYGPKGISLFYGLKSNETELKSGFEISKGGVGKKLQFRARDESGNEVNQSLGLLQNKALVIQILGSWCPNCLDETRFLSAAFSQKPKGVEFIGLAFERKPDLKQSFDRINVLRSRLKVPYPIFYGGSANKDSAKAAVLFLDRVFAFPTTVFVKADGTIYKVHSGFSGPATGKIYKDWESEFNRILNAIDPDKN